ncbi:hypothetical protein B0T12DRAFT_398684 [Alternaria alternata]|nr:hypothetical protein B0T12DRAFT_398684 [Alternaria alternata]
MRSSIVIQLSTLSVGVLGGVVPGPYYVNSTTTIGTPRPHVHAPGLPTPPTTLSASISDSNTAIVAPYPTSSSNTSVVDASPSSSTAYAVSSSSPEVSTVTLSVSSSLNVTTQNATLIYSPLVSSATVTSPSSIPTSEYPPVVVIVVAETVYATAQQPNSTFAYNATLPTATTSDCLTTLPASANQSSPSVVPSSATVSSILPGLALAAEIGIGEELASSSIDLGLLSSILLPDSSTINLGLLSSILLSEVTQRSVGTTYTTTTTTVIFTPTPLVPSLSSTNPSISGTTTTTVVAPTTASPSASIASPTSTSTSDSVVPSSSAVESRSTSPSESPSTILSTVTVTTPTPSSPSSTESNAEFPTAPPFSYNPSASRGSAPPISRPTPEPSSANVAGSTLSTAATPTSTRISQYGTGVPPAPSAAGASGVLSERNKERVWWVAFFGVASVFLY